MSFSDNYYALLEEEKKKKKKKATEQKTGHSFTDTYNELMADADIAPTVNITTDAPLFTQRTAPFFERGVSLPVRTTVTKGEEEKDLDFFQKGAFEDGWDKGDLWKTILGTGADAIVGLGKGVSKLVEGVVDAGSYGVAGIADAFGSEEYADKVRKKAQKNAVDDYFADVDAFYDQYSVLGKTSDAIAEGLGQVGGIILTGGLGAAAGLGTAGVTALTTATMGVSGLGSGMGEAYTGGASDKEAATYGLIKGVVDAGSELIFGGLGKTVKALGLSRGLSSLDDMFARKLSSKLTNQVAKNFVEYGVKATGEGVEEVLAGLGSAIGKKLTYMSDEELSKLVKDENLLEQFVVGTVVSGFAQGGDLNASNKSNRDFVSGLSQNEQKVVDYEVQKRTDGQKLTSKQKNSIYDDVIRDMERGYISTDTIEEVLGGDTYKSHTDAIARETALRDEYDTLYKMKNGEKSDEQIDRQAELKRQLEEIEQTFDRNRLGTEVMTLVQNERLAESYNERSRRGQAFEADISKYDAKMQATIQKAIDSGILNNTNRTHEFVDMIAKITADKGVLFDFTNNERLKESGFAVDGKAVNGYLTKDGVTLNIDSSKSLNSVVGHEITHVLEGTDLYYELQNAVTSYAKAKGDYRGRYNTLVKLYEGVEGADIKAELTADLVGDYLFTDTDFVRNLSVQNRNVFQKIYDEIKYLYKVATAGSKEARELEKVKRVFEQAYKESGKGQSETKYSLSDSDGNQLSSEQQEYFKNSVVRDENGNLKRMYHGTSKGGFTVFDTYGSNHGLFGQGSYFTDDPEVGLSYTKKGKGNNPELYEVYLNITNPIDMDAPADAAAWREAFPDADFPENGTNEQFYRAMEQYFADEMYEKWEAASYAVETIQGMGFDGITHIGGGRYNKRDTNRHRVYIAFEPEQVKNFSNKKPTENPDIRYSLSNAETDKSYLSAVENGDMDTARQIMEKVAKRRGYTIHAYHGTARGDRVGNVFLPERATSGPMAFFTDSKEIAENYSKSKQDTSMAYDPDYDRYETQFRIKAGTLDIPLYRAWGYLPFDARRRITQKAGQLREDWDGDNELILDPDTNDANGGFQWQLKEARGNAIQALTEQWLNSGNLFNEEARFLEVLEMAGVTEEFKKVKGMGELYFKDPNAKHEKVYDTFLRIRKPFDTATVDEQFVADLEAWYDEQDQDQYVRENMESDLWDKNGIDAYDFAERLRNDLEHNTTHAWTSIPDSVTDYLKHLGYDGIKDTGGKFTGYGHTVWIPFASSQIKSAETVTYDDAGNVIPITERFDKKDVDIRQSLSNVGEEVDNHVLAPISKYKYGSQTYGKDIALEAPVREGTVSETETVAENATVDENLFPDDIAPVEQELERLEQEREALEAQWETMGEDEDFSEVQARWQEVVQRIEELETEAGEADAARLNSLDDMDVPMEQEAPYSEGQPATVDDPFEERDYADVGQRSVKAYMYENPEVKPFFQAEAEGMLGDLRNSLKGQKWFNDEVYYATGGEHGWGGTKRHTTDDIAYLLDGGYTYAQIEKGLNAIIEDNGAENNAVSKRIEFALNDRLLNGFRDLEGRPIPPNEDYIRLLQEKQITEYSKEAFDAFMENADSYAPPAEEDIAPVVKPARSVAMDAPVAVKSEAIRPKKQTAQPRMAKATPAEQASAQVLTEEPKVDKKKPKIGAILKDNLIDRGTIFETLSLKTGNRELQAKFKSIGRAESSAQWFMEHGNASTNSLKTIRDTVEKSGKTQAFYEYLYHRHNVDRMNLEGRYPDMENKPVFGYGVTSEISKAEAENLEKANPEFKQWANSVYSYMTELREMMVDNGVISRKTANLWAEMYPHYVPIRRKGDDGLNINVALDTKRTGINAPIKKATGGNRDILPLFDTMAMRTEQTFRAVARNSFGVELKNMLGSTIEKGDVSVDEAIDSVETELLQEGKDGKNPTFTVFEDGKRVTFEITEEMYDTMQPKSKFNSYTNKVLNKANDIRRGLLTEYNPAFMLTNPIKDTQDVMINSQHPARTYANYLKAIAELIGKKGQYYQEYMEHGGEQNTYFDGETKTFSDKKKGIPFLRKISEANNFIERIPRMAEYIASRKMGRSIDVSMLDAARVTTDFSAGGDFVKTLNRNGFTFLNASVQGAVQQVRNVREAKAEGLKGWVKLATKVAVAGLPAVLLNHLLWDDDEDYAELSDYVKQNYYIVAKYGDGKFVRIPKGRALAVIQNGFEQIGNLLTGNDEADFGTFAELVISNLAPNNPLENNLIAPVMQAKNNTTWYGEDLVPTRLQDLPAAEQYDETTDALSKWLGEKTNISPYKLNYVLDQYSGALGDMFLPMMTPEAERGNDSAWGNLIAPLSDKFTTDGVLKNQNVSDFYTKKDELTVKANASGATDDDVLMSKYMNSMNAELAELYAKKRELQNSDMPNAEKYEAVRDVQKQIVELTEEALNTYGSVTYDNSYREGGKYARVGDRVYKLNDKGEWDKLSDDQRTKYEVTKAAGNAPYADDGTNYYRWYKPENKPAHWEKLTDDQVTKYLVTRNATGVYATNGTQHYRLNEGGDPENISDWTKLSDREVERQNEVTRQLGITPEEYWSKTEKSMFPMYDGEYEYAYDNPENYAVAKAVGGYEAYKGYSGELYDIKADKDENGKSISGSRKEKVLDYINNLDADYYTKIILWKSEYPSDDSNNYEIIEYLNGREDISFEETISILRKLGFDVTDDGDISW